MFKRILKAFLVNLNSFCFVLHVALQAFGHGKDQKNTRWSAHLMLWHSQEMLVSNLNHKSLITRKKHWSEGLKKSQSQQTETLRIYCKVEVGVGPQQMPSHKDRAWKGTWNSLKLPGDEKKTTEFEVLGTITWQTLSFGQNPNLAGPPSQPFRSPQNLQTTPNLFCCKNSREHSQKSLRASRIELCLLLACGMCAWLYASNFKVSS